MMGTVLVKDMTIESLRGSCPTIYETLSLLGRSVNYAVHRPFVLIILLLATVAFQ